MAKQVLPVNFTDDLLAESMDGKRKYRMIDNGDGTVSLEDVSEYLQMGSVFGAGQINSTNQAVNESVDKDKILKTLEEVSASTDSDAVVGRGAVAELNQNMSGLSFGQDAEGNWGYKPSGADSVIPFKSSSNVRLVYKSTEANTYVEVSLYIDDEQVFTKKAIYNKFNVDETFST